jgi:Ni,Fe-hydrogenase III small subunit
MLDLIRTRLAQGRQTSSFPEGDAGFPERFRGRPIVVTDPAAPVSPAEGIPTRMPGQDPQGLPVLDLGACLFSPEEAAPLPRSPAAPQSHYRAAYTADHRMASRTRDGLIAPLGEVELAQALDAKMRSLLGRSLRLRSVSAGSCNGCEGELTALSNVVFDMARFGIQFVASPRHADGIVITGAVSRNMRDALERTYEAVPDPRLVIAVGACACSGGPFAGSPEVMNGVPEEIPVDLWIPGCPPHPITVLDGLLRLLGRIADPEVP